MQAYGQFDRAEQVSPNPNPNPNPHPNPNPNPKPNPKPNPNQLFESASRIHKKHLGDAHPHNIAALNNLALLYQAKGDATKEQAMRMLVKMLQSRNEPVPGA